MYQHWKAQVSIVQKRLAPLPWCPRCGMNMHVKRMIRNQKINRCNWATEMLLQRHDVEIYESVGEMKFCLYGREDDALIDRRTY